MLEKLIVFILIMLAIGLILLRIRATLKGNACSGCTSNCNSCNSQLPIVIKDEHKN